MLTLLFSINVLTDLIGIPFFFLLVYKLHGTCHKLIGIYAICCVLAKVQIIPPYFIMITKINNIPLWLCALTDTIPIAGSFNIYSLMVVIAVDRILSIYFPIWYSARGDSFHFPFILFPLIFIIFVIINVLQDPFRQNICYLNDLITTNNVSNFRFICLILNWTTVFCYILLIIKIFIENKKGLKMDLYKSLFLIMGIQLGGWMFSLLGYNLTNNGVFNNFNENTNDILGTIINCISSLSSTCEVPAIFLSSSKHFEALKKMFGYETSSVYYLTTRNRISPDNNKNNLIPNNLQNI
ncbi:hypothetical protein Mgra_00004738 [Meloidogyne graminicola]|uniref:G_PROTEIN_RECEP_F1_2 domain-containing protein n=1 Tax=Meloidogyne graminicola TaxID=189291 RepID=A0A8S9ZRC3_9BILA|nr:hypothetical protein Mgra_00004738 [Meloidogyne graminicola]